VNEGNCTGLLCNVTDTLNTIGQSVGFWQDPFGNTFKALQVAAKGLAQDVLPALTEATLPDLNARWFLNAYAISFAMALMFAVILLIPQFVNTARGTMAGRDLVQSVGLYFTTFILGAMFGPLFGLILVNFFHALSKEIIKWGVAGSFQAITDKLTSMVATTDPATMTGGVFIACLLMLLMVIGLLLIVLVLIVQLVTLYFTGVLVPLGLVWIIDPNRRSFGLRLVQLWIGILAAHPLLFFLLGFAFNMIGSITFSIGTNNAPLKTLVSFVVALIALFMAALSPLLLLKFAPVIPTGMGGTNGPQLGGSSIGSNNLTEAGSRYGDTGSSTGNSSQSSAVPAGESTPSIGGSGLGSAASGGGSTAAAGEAVGTGASAGAGATAVEGLIAAGAAESATGAGAAIGVPTLIAAGAVAAASKAMEVGQAAQEQAISPMDDTGTIGEQSV